MAVVKKEFGKNSKGEQAYFYEITNEAGMKAIVTDFGATLHSLYVPDKDGNFRDVVWGYDTVEEYEIDNGPFFGATVGRIANRVGGAAVTVNGVSLTVCNPTDDSFQVAIIPYTYEHTNFHTFQVGSVVNIEFDIIGKYLSRMMHFNS